MSKVVFDASALLISINKELGFEAVDEIVHGDDVLMSSVNVAEVITKMTLRGSSASAIDATLGVYRLAIAPFHERNAITAGLLVAQTRDRGLSLADRACLTLALELRLPVVTADRAWADLDLGIDVRLVR